MHTVGFVNTFDTSKCLATKQRVAQMRHGHIHPKTFPVAQVTENLTLSHLTHSVLTLCTPECLCLQPISFLELSVG